MFAVFALYAHKNFWTDLKKNVYSGIYFLWELIQIYFTFASNSSISYRFHGAILQVDTLTSKIAFPARILDDEFLNEEYEQVQLHTYI